MGKFLVDDTSHAESAGSGIRLRTNDDLQLDSLQAPDIPPHIIFPDQLNRYFREQVHNLTHENGSLRRSLEEMETELKAAKQKLAKAESTPASSVTALGVRSSEVAYIKISELSKRVREQNAELESLRYRAKDAESKLREIEDNNSQKLEPPPSPAPNEIKEKDRQIKSLNERIQSTNAKMCDIRNQCQTLKQELKLALRVIENEVGEKFVLQELARDGSNWRGRAQQIITLQNKVQHLQEQLTNTSGADTPAVSVIRQMEKDRRASYEETSKKLNQKIIDMEQVQKKLDASKARNKVLESDVFQVKTKLASLLEKGVRDEQLITALTAQINVFEDRGKAHIQQVNKMQDNIYKLQQEINLEKSKNEQLQKALMERENRIQRMEDQVEELKKQKRTYVKDDTYKQVDLSVKGHPLSPNRKPIPFAETERIRLLELLAVVNRRLDDARREQGETETQLRKEKCKNAKMETRIARLELERVGAIKTGRNSYSSGRPVDNSFGDLSLTAKHQIEYLEEECLALRTRIKTLQMEKEDDFKSFANMVDLREKAVHDREKLLPRPKLQLSAKPFREEKKSGKSSSRSLGSRLPRKSLTPPKSMSLRQSSFLSEDSRFQDRTPHDLRLPL